MNYDEYMDEHGDDYYRGKDGALHEKPYIPSVVGECAYCHEEVTSADERYPFEEYSSREQRNVSKVVHSECVMEYILDRYDEQAIAKAMGYELQEGM